MLGLMSAEKSLATVFRPPESDVPTIDATAGDISRPSPIDLQPAAAPGARYEERSLLGRGGMGEVRLCKDARIGREVAVKVAHRGDGERVVRQRFLREARVQGQLEHPAIVPVYDLEVLDDGSAYFVMKRVRGTTLAAILSELQRGDEETRRRFPTRKLLSAIASVCLAVDFAHTKGVIHRDIKPGNIMLGDFGEVYLLDWGLAKVVGVDDDVGVDTGALGTDAATVAGTILGTPGYMAPEQIDPARGPVGPAADIYALGCVLFECVALERYVVGRDLLEVTMATLQGAEPRPSRRRPGASAALDEVCARALALLPAARFSSARALHDELDRYLSGEHDRERRRALARSQLEAALRRPDTLEGRATALQELGSALVLDSTNPDAHRALQRLLNTPPPQMPPEVKQAVDAQIGERTRQLARSRTVASLIFLPFFPLMVLLLGIVEWWSFAMSIGLLLVTSSLNFWIGRTAGRARWQWVADVVLFASIACIARIAGPLLLLPAVLVAYAVESQMHPSTRHRRRLVIGCCAVLTLLFVVDQSGLVEPMVTVIDGAIVVSERMVHINGALLWLLFFASMTCIIGPSIASSQQRAALAEAEAKLQMQAWQHAQLVPPGV
jgi:serine/threonine protein kinase